MKKMEIKKIVIKKTKNYYLLKMVGHGKLKNVHGTFKK